jgi:hypothetical protein
MKLGNFEFDQRKRLSAFEAMQIERLQHEAGILKDIV